MIPEAPFLFSIAALSASLAGLAGLVAGLRRGADVRPIDLFRLREIVEFAFANVLLAIGVVPLTLALADGALAVRVAAAIGISYGVVTVIVLARRSRLSNLAWTRGWTAAAIVINLAAAVAGVYVLASGSISAYLAFLVALLARPMVAFLLVLASFESQ